MTVLAALLTLAFVALLWATFSIAGFVRRARRRQRRRTAAENEASLRPDRRESPVRYTDVEAAPIQVPSDLSREAAAIPAFDAALPSPARVDGAASAISELLEPVPVPPPPRLRSFPTRFGKHSALSPATDAGIPKWNPFRDELADLSDPTPNWRTAARSKEKR